jgi:hypothetical protein
MQVNYMYVPLPVTVDVAIIRDLTSSHFEYASTIRNIFHRNE